MGLTLFLRLARHAAHPSGWMPGRAHLVVLFVAVFSLCPFGSYSAYAQMPVNRPVRLIVPFAPGGAADRVARVTAERLTATFSQQFVVDNRPGAAGAVGYDMLYRATPDGLTLGTASYSATLIPLVQKGTRWDPREFSAISLLTIEPLVLAVHTSVPAKALPEFIAYTRTKPGAISFGSSGHGHPQHLTGELIKRAGGIDMTHVPFKGGGAAIIDLVGGHIQAAVLGSSPVIPLNRAGRVRILAVTSAKRSPTIPEVPTLAESGITGIDIVQWIGPVGPPKLSKALVERLNGAIVNALQASATRGALESTGAEVESSTPEQLVARFRETMQRWEQPVRELKLAIE